MAGTFYFTAISSGVAPSGGAGFLGANGFTYGGGIGPQGNDAEWLYTFIVPAGTDDSVRVALGRPGTLRRFTVDIPVGFNSLLVPTVISVAINGVNTALSLSIPAGTDGVFSIDVPVAVTLPAALSFHGESPGSGLGESITGSSSVEFL